MPLLPTVDEMISQVGMQLINSRTVSGDLKTSIQWAIDHVIHTICDEVDLSDFIVEKELPLVAGTQDYDLAEDFFRMVEPGVYLKGIQDSYLQHYREQERVLWGDTSTTDQGQPRAYTLRERQKGSGDARIRLHLVPDKAYTLVYSYFSRPEPVAPPASPTATTIDARFPRKALPAILYGACLEFPKYSKGDALVVWRGKYEAALENISPGKISGHVFRQKPQGMLYDRSYGPLAWRRGLSGDLHV